MWTIVPDRKKEEDLSYIKKPSDWSGLDVYFIGMNIFLEFLARNIQHIFVFIRKRRQHYIFIGFDSLSQMSFRRKLPKTVKYIEEEFDAVVLDGMQRSFNNNIRKRNISFFHE